MHILIVDDEAINRKLLRSILEAEGLHPIYHLHQRLHFTERLQNRAGSEINQIRFYT